MTQYFICRKITKASEHSGDTGYEYYEPVRECTDIVNLRALLPRDEYYSCNHDVHMCQPIEDSDLTIASAEEEEMADFIALAANIFANIDGEK